MCGFEKLKGLKRRFLLGFCEQERAGAGGFSMKSEFMKLIRANVWPTLAPWSGEAHFVA